MKHPFPLQDLKDQLEQARAADPSYRRFGAKRHQYRWNPPASPKAVEAFERKIGTTLPEEYRDFLLQAGNGGAGPFYGLFSLEAVESWLQWDLESDKPPLLSPGTDLEERTVEEENWRRGCLLIESEGDIYFTGLMVSGPNRGRVVYIDYEGSWVFFPSEPDFLSWYQRWLREVRNQYQTFWFATNLDGDEQALRDYYQQVETEEEKREVLTSMLKFPAWSQETESFLKTALLERLDVEDARAFLTLLFRLDQGFFAQFLQQRWQAGRYDGVVSEIWYTTWHREEENEDLIEQWWEVILQALPQLSEQTLIKAVHLLRKSGKVRLGQIRWVWERAEETETKVGLLEEFSRFKDAAEHLDLWLGILEEREELELLNQAIVTVPKVYDPQLKEAFFRIQQGFSFAVELLLNVDDEDAEAMVRYNRRRKENEIYRNACWKWKEIWQEEINPKVVGIPRPYRLTLSSWDRTNLHLDETPPENGIGIHPIIALAIRNQFHHLPSTAYDWERLLGRIKRLGLMLDRTTVGHWDDEARTVVLLPPDEMPLPKPFYYSMEDWSAIGRMKNLKNLFIWEICVEDFSFLPKCQSLTNLYLNNTNFTDCRLLLKLPKLKQVELSLCRLEHTEVLKSAPFTCQRKDWVEV